jgi:hypothetical protein
MQRRHFEIHSENAKDPSRLNPDPNIARNWPSSVYEGSGQKKGSSQSLHLL